MQKSAAQESLCVLITCWCGRGAGRRPVGRHFVRRGLSGGGCTGRRGRGPKQVPQQVCGRGGTSSGVGVVVSNGGGMRRLAGRVHGLPTQTKEVSLHRGGGGGGGFGRGGGAGVALLAGEREDLIV